MLSPWFIETRIAIEWIDLERDKRIGTRVYEHEFSMAGSVRLAFLQYEVFSRSVTCVCLWLPCFREVKNGERQRLTMLLMMSASSMQRGINWGDESAATTLQIIACWTTCVTFIFLITIVRIILTETLQNFLNNLSLIWECFRRWVLLETQRQWYLNLNVQMWGFRGWKYEYWSRLGRCAFLFSPQRLVSYLVGSGDSSSVNKVR
jgi:hypothetical protein